MSAASTASRWRDGVLEAREDCDLQPASIDVADSWFVTEGRALALDLHRARFLGSLPRARLRELDPEAFWDAAVASIPRAGDWFPRVELRSQPRAPQLLFRLRPAPPRRRSIVLATWEGRDPRRSPRIKGPDLEAMVRVRTTVQARGADDAALLTPAGHVGEGSTTCLVWWRGDALAIPDDSIERIDSVSLRSVLAIAVATGVEVRHESATPTDLDGCEVWALNALHGIRIVTRWIDGPQTAEQPGRLDDWRRRLDALRRPLPAPDRPAPDDPDTIEGAG